MNSSFFLLGTEARRRFLPIAGRFLGCTYICSWSPLCHPAPFHLVSEDGWHHEEDGGPSSSSGTSISSRLFDAYRRSLCSIQFHTSSVPGVAYKDGLAYVQLTDVDILNLSSNHSQRQFYQEAEIKTAVFMGCRQGEIELGFRTPPNPKVNLQRNIQQVLSEEFIQQSLGSADLETMASSEPGQLSSSSSSLRSFSLGSTNTSPRLLAQQSPPFIMQSFEYFMAPRTEEDEAMARALLAVIISSPLILNQQHVGVQMGAFRPYYNNPFTPDEEEYLKPNRHSQRMIKIGLHMLRRISMMKLQLAAAPAQEYQQPMSNQSQHVISERKRRQKFNDHFNALKMLLPLEPKKKDKTTVLINVTNYLNLLKAQIKELEQRNSALEMQVQVPKEDQVDMSICDSNERVEVQVNRASESTSETQLIDLRVVVKEDCDMIDWFIRVLQCLKEMRGMISMETRTVSSENNRFGIASFRLQVETSYWVEATFKEAVRSAVAKSIILAS